MSDKYPFSCPCGRLLDHQSLLNKVEAGQGVFDRLIYSCPECLMIFSFDRKEDAKRNVSPIPTHPARTILSSADGKRLLDLLGAALEDGTLAEFLGSVRGDDAKRWGLRPVRARDLVGRRPRRRWRLAVDAWARVGSRVIDGLEDRELMPTRVRVRFTEKHPSGALLTRKSKRAEQMVLWPKGTIFTEARVPKSVPDWLGADRERWEIILTPPARTRPPNEELYSAPLDLIDPVGDGAP